MTFQELCLTGQRQPGSFFESFPLEIVEPNRSHKLETSEFTALKKSIVILVLIIMLVKSASYRLLHNNNSSSSSSSSSMNYNPNGSGKECSNSSISYSHDNITHNTLLLGSRPATATATTTRRWTFTHSMLTSILLILSFQAMARIWNHATCHIQAALTTTTTDSIRIPILSHSRDETDHDRGGGQTPPPRSTEQDSSSSSNVRRPVVADTETIPRKSLEATSKAAKTVVVPPTIVEWNGFNDMVQFAKTFFSDRNLYCERIDQERKSITGSNTVDEPLPTIATKISFGCQELFQNGGYGTGNYISLLYGFRMAAQLHANVGLELHCTDAAADNTAVQRSLILPWLTGRFPPRPVGVESPYATTVPMANGCGPYSRFPTSRMAREIQYDFRRMAIGLVGVPYPKHPSGAFAQTHLVGVEQQEANADGDINKIDAVWKTNAAMQAPVDQDNPVFPKGSIELDDVVIHFRCGDLMDSDHPNFAFVRFQTYMQHISPQAKSIGILTQPFRKFTESGKNEAVQTRDYDDSDTVRDRCQTVVLALVHDIQEQHPNSRISIHNGPSETIALAYARMVMANQSIAAVSTFGVFPVIASFGTGYLHRPSGGPFPNGWLFDPRVDEFASNVRLFDNGDYIMVKDIKNLWETQGQDGVLAWFRNHTV